MKSQIIEILEMLLLAGVLAILALVLKTEKKRILALVQGYIREAESSIQGSNLGPEKKKVVLARLEAAGISINQWLDKAIDSIVKELNEKGAWALKEAGDQNG